MKAHAYAFIVLINAALGATLITHGFRNYPLLALLAAAVWALVVGLWVIRRLDT